MKKNSLFIFHTNEGLICKLIIKFEQYDPYNGLMILCLELF